MTFGTAETGIKCGDTQASFTGATAGALRFVGSDQIVTLGCAAGGGVGPGGNSDGDGVAGVVVPGDGIYHVAVMPGGGSSFWQFSNLDFHMTNAPGVAQWTQTDITISQLTASGLAQYDILVEPSNDRSYVNAAVQSAVAQWVLGGGILILAPDSSGLSGSDPLVAALGTAYSISWSGPSWCGQVPLIVDPTDPLVSLPNVLTGFDIQD